MITLRQLSPDDGEDVYELLQALPPDENGVTNEAHGMNGAQFADWLREQDADSRQVGLRDGYKVPQTTFWLCVNGEPVGMGKIRHFLTDALRVDGGNIGYSVAPRARGKGYGKELLRALTAEAAKRSIENALLVIHVGNTPSLRTALGCGGKLEKTENGRHYVWVPCGKN